MRWQGRKGSRNVEDRRGMPVGGMLGGGLGTILLVLFITFLGGGDPSQVLNELLVSNSNVSTEYIETEAEKELAEFSSVVLAETEKAWTDLFAEQGLEYSYPTLVLYSGRVQSACGIADSSTGPFYCPGDQKIYIDLSFYDELHEKFKAPGDFAMAYVIAHEVGHHVQYQLGTLEKVMSLRSRLSQKQFNQYMVRLELQADYYAGVWAHYANKEKLLEPGDIEEALKAASAVGDDRIQKENYGYAVPDTFTHGTSEQRQRWFYKGYTEGTIRGGDTFNATQL
jgi:predicted metalloprotease